MSYTSSTVALQDFDDGRLLLMEMLCFWVPFEAVVGAGRRLLVDVFEFRQQIIYNILRRLQDIRFLLVRGLW